MKAKRIWMPICVLLAALLVYNLGIAFMARKSQRGRLVRELRQLPPQTEFLFLGNSLMEAGLEINTFRSHLAATEPKPSAINLALGGTSPVEHALILQEALGRVQHPKFVIYGFFDDQLLSPVQGNWSDLVGNRALSYRFPKKAAEYYWPQSRLASTELQLVSLVPMLAQRSMVWSKIELLRRKLEGVGMPKQETNRYGRVQDFSALEPKDAASFEQRCATELRANAGFSAPVLDIIQNAQAHGAQVILLEMPLPSHHREIFYSLPEWKNLERYLESCAVEKHATYLSASDWIPDDNCFEDATHLNENGARIFSRKLAAALSGR